MTPASRAYADDIACFLNEPQELRHLLTLLSQYSGASNALVNYHKTVALSLSGSRRSFTTHWVTSLTACHITQWHDSSSVGPVVYLGYPLYTTPIQRDFFLSSLLEKIKKACDIHRSRQFSVRGRATIVNSLILSKLWHILRVVSVPLSFFGDLRTIISSFVSFRIFPRLSYSTIQA